VSYAQYLTTRAPLSVSNLSTITLRGPRIAVSTSQRYTVQLPSPEKLKKVELCRTERTRTTCKLLVVRATGASVDIQIPATAPLGASYIQVTERLPSGGIGRVLSKRSVLVRTAPTPVVEQENESTGSSRSTTSSRNSEEASVPTPPQPADTLQATFTLPMANTSVSASAPVDVHLRLPAPVTCGRWLLNGVVITPEQWVDGQMPTTTPCS